ncbi:hypothetical protein F4810DRAFT_711240 [Camillea tinctor]|nr:hypothetical protein F4810DRAFT_711240 [Camillea tinctor]
MLTTILLILWVAGFRLTVRADGVVCYAPYGVTIASNDTYVPCNKLGITQAGVYSSCCALDGDPDQRDLCATTGLCLNNGVIRRESCTDPTWNSATCVNICTDSSVAVPVARSSVAKRHGSQIATSGPLQESHYCFSRNPWCGGYSFIVEKLNVPASTQASNVEPYRDLYAAGSPPHLSLSPAYNQHNKGPSDPGTGIHGASGNTRRYSELDATVASRGEMGSPPPPPFSQGRLSPHGSNIPSLHLVQ